MPWHYEVCWQFLLIAPDLTTVWVDRWRISQIGNAHYSNLLHSAKKTLAQTSMPTAPIKAPEGTLGRASTSIDAANYDLECQNSNRWNTSVLDSLKAYQGFLVSPPTPLLSNFMLCQPASQSHFHSPSNLKMIFSIKLWTKAWLFRFVTCKMLSQICEMGRNRNHIPI